MTRFLSSRSEKGMGVFLSFSLIQGGASIRTTLLTALKRALVGSALLSLLAAAPAHAVTLWYNGDFDHVDGQPNLQNFCCSGEAHVYDDFYVPTTWTINSVFANNLITSLGDDCRDNLCDAGPITSAAWSIRAGISSGNGGTIIAGGISPATQIATGNTFQGYLTEYTIAVTGLNIVLGPGTYWLNVTPIGNGRGQSFNSNTSGANSVNALGNNGNSFLVNTFSGYDFLPFSADYSMGVAGNIGNQVPEPSTLLLLASGLAALVGLKGFKGKGIKGKFPVVEGEIRREGRRPERGFS